MPTELPTKEVFEKYVRVQRGGRYNMFGPRARRATGLGKGEYAAVMHAYDELSRKYPDVVAR